VNAIVQARDVTGQNPGGAVYCDGQWIKID